MCGEPHPWLSTRLALLAGLITLAAGGQFSIGVLAFLRANVTLKLTPRHELSLADEDTHPDGSEAEHQRQTPALAPHKRMAVCQTRSVLPTVRAREPCGVARTPTRRFTQTSGTRRLPSAPPSPP